MLRFSVAVLIASVAPLCAQQWTRLTTPHFELYTTAGEKKGRETILFFEQVRSFFLQASPAKRASEFPVRIILFRNDKEYTPYKVNEFAAAFYTRSRKRDYIVMRDFSSENSPIAVHEYMHLIIRDAGLKVPIWFNEGWADLFSTLKPRGKKAIVGELIPGRVQTVLTGKWIPLEQLAEVDHSSPLYNERNKASMFYSESWVFTHMLFLSDDYRPNFSKFVALLAEQKSLADALMQAYGKTVRQVDTDVQRYLKTERLYSAAFDIKLTKSEEEAASAPVDAVEADVVTADLLAAMNRRDEAKTAYARLSKAGADRPEIEEALAYMAWQSSGEEAALPHFEKAFKLGIRDPQVCYHFGVLAQNAGRPASEVVKILGKAVELKPDFLDAQLALGAARINAKDYAGAIADLTRIKRIDPDKAPRLFSALAYAYALAGAMDDARKNAELTRKWAKTPEDIARADDMLRYIDSRKAADEARASAQAAAAAAPQAPPAAATADPPPQQVFEPPAPNAQRTSQDFPDEKIERIEGVAQQLDCMGNTARFVVLAGGKRLSFFIADPGKVSLKHKGAWTFDFTCGPQKPFPVAVEYVAKQDAATKTVGIVTSLEF
jgi:tetratricopeptide (TPR) repeat protein